MKKLLFIILLLSRKLIIFSDLNNEYYFTYYIKYLKNKESTHRRTNNFAIINNQKLLENHLKQKNKYNLFDISNIIYKMQRCYKDPFLNNIFGYKNYYQRNSDRWFTLQQNLIEIAKNIAYSKE
jgi:hypothetical protein